MRHGPRKLIEKRFSRKMADLTNPRVSLRDLMATLETRDPPFRHMGRYLEDNYIYQFSPRTAEICEVTGNPRHEQVFNLKG